MMNVWFCYACGKGLKPKEHYCDGCIEKINKLPVNDDWAKGKTIINLRGLKTTEAELDEVRRRVPLNVKKNGTYDLGRLGENGKVRDREPSYGDWG